MVDSRIALDLSSSEALVFHDWLATAHEKGMEGVDEASGTVLWDLESQLEPLLLAIVQTDYAVQVARAKAIVLGRGEP